MTDTYPKNNCVELEEVWSHKSYAKYKNAIWNWRDLPFADNVCRPKITFGPIRKPITGASILELGSAMGQAYAYMQSSKAIDLSDYSGIEVSRMGYETCKQCFPGVNWVHADFTKYTLERLYDYTFERHAIHHMQNPLEQYRKVIGHTKISFQTLFRGCVAGKTVSDIAKGHFISDSGLIYLNVINLFDVIDIGLENGFNHIGVLYYGVHESISSEPSAKVFLDAEVQKESGGVHRFGIRMTRCGFQHEPVLNVKAKYLKDVLFLRTNYFHETISNFLKRKSGRN